MPLRTGAQYISSLEDNRQVQLHGTPVYALARHPAFRGCIHSVAKIYDCQFDSEVAEILTMSGGNAGSLESRAFHVPRSVEDLQAKRRMIEYVARMNGGTIGRPPDFVPLILMGLLDAKRIIAQKNHEWARNIERYFEYCRVEDLFLSHSFADRQVDRSKPSAEINHLRYNPSNDGGIRVSGVKAVATAAPIANEYLVLTPPRDGLSAEQAIFFSVPVATPGLHFVCREAFARDFAPDHPLSTRFDEMDAWAVFDQVHVPADRIFLAGEVEAISVIWRNLLTLAYYHFLVRITVKTEVFLGTTSLIADYIGTAGFQGIKENLADIARYLETIKAFVRAAEADTITSASGIVMPHPRVLAVGHMYAIEHHHRLIETLLDIGGQSVLMAPSLANQKAQFGPHVLPGCGGEDEQRRRVFRLAWDLAGSSFAGRQYMFEIFSGRDLTRNRLAFFERYDLTPQQALVQGLTSSAI